MAKNIEVRILGDARPLQRSLNGASRNVKEFEGHMGRAGRGALSASGSFSHLGRSIAFASGAFLGAAGFTSVVKQSVEAAMSLEKEMAKTRAVFGSNTKAVDAWSKTTANSFGIARSEALKSANQFGQMFKVMGVGNRESVKMSKSLTELSAKLALFAGKTQEEAAAALAGGLTGRTRALKAYGIVIDQTTIKAEAMRLGLIKSTVSSRAVEEAQTRLAIATAKAAEAHAKYGANTTQVAAADLAVQKAHDSLAKATGGVAGALTAAAKAHAIYSLVQGQSKAASETWRREQGSAEVQMKRLKAEIHDTEVTIGNALLPTVLKITTKMADWLGKTENQKLIQHDLNVVVKTAGTVLGTLKDIVQGMAPFVRGLNSALGGTKHTFELLLALGIAAKLRAIAVSLQLVGASAATAGGEAGVGGLLAKLTRLKTMGPIALTVVMLIDLLKSQSATDFLQRLGGYISGRGGGALGKIGGGSIVDLLGQATGQKGGTPQSQSATASQRHGVGQSGGLQLQPTYAGATHPTAGLPGYPAHDVFAQPGTRVGAPEAGTITRLSGHDPAAGSSGSAGVLGYSIYLHADSGATYFMTHFAQVFVRVGQHVVRGTPLGTVAYHPRGSHIHIGKSQTFTPEAAAASSTGGGGTTGSLTVGTSAAKSTWKGATEATIIAAKASVTSMLKAAQTVIGGMGGPMDDIERAAEDHLRKLREHLHPHMTAADLARTKADIAKWGKVLNDEIQAQTKRAKQAFDQAAKQLLRAFDKETAAGLKARAAPDETPTEALLRQRQENRDDAARQKALQDAIASGDQQAISDAEYEIETARLEKIAAAERKAADEKAASDQEAYQQARDDQRQALQDQHDDWNAWLTKKAKSWNQFWKWVQAHPHGGDLPSFGATTSTSRPGSPAGSPGSGVIIAEPPSPSMAIVSSSPLATSAGLTVVVNVGTVIGNDLQEAGRQLADPVRRELLRTNKSNGGGLGFT